MAAIHVTKDTFQQEVLGRLLGTVVRTVSEYGTDRRRNRR